MTKAALTPRRAWSVLLLALAFLAAGVATYRTQADFRGDILRIELSGSGQELPREAGLQEALLWDFALITGYGTCLLLLSWLATQVFWTPTALRLARSAVVCSAAAVVLDLVENALLLVALASPDGPAVLLDLAAGAAAMKFTVLLLAGPVALASVLTTVGRLWSNRRPGRLWDISTWPTPPPAAAAPVAGTIPPAREAGGEGREAGTTAAGLPVEAASLHDRWQRGYLVPGIEAELAVRPVGEARTGFCVSGGGIRSASVALGALQGLRAELLRARYLTSVSGGGYTAGALQLALQPDTPGGQSVATPADVLLPGTPEEDHVRRHSNYIADGAAQWLLAMGVVLRGVFASLLLMTATVAALGVGLGLFYGAVPLVTGLDGLAVRSSDMDVPPFPDFSAGMTSALVASGCAAVVAWLTALTLLGRSRRAWTLLRQVSEGLALLTLGLAAVGVVVPALVWASAAVLTVPADLTTTVAAGGGGTILASYVAALASMVWRRREAVGETVGRFRRTGENGTRAIPGGLAQRLLVMVVVLVLATTLLLVLGSVLGTTAAWVAGAQIGDVHPLWLLLGAVVVLAWLGGMVDQTWLSLHPFYRRRLASAFAVRRIRRPDGGTEARAYDYDGERTSLSVCGARRDGFPEVVFCAAANLSGQDHASPGRRAVSFTMTSQWLGGPDVGYVSTPQLERAVSPYLAMDMTVQAAVAVSGAAFASAMGRHARSAQTLLALTNARLGTWLPNPHFVAEQGRVRRWTSPGLPSKRRVTYLLREVFGSYRADERLLYVTDGGHYENLALVELLRRRATEIFCIDASGDTPPMAGALGEALALAYEELGVRIVLDDPRHLVPGGGDPLDPSGPLSELNGRLSRSAVLRGTVHYPAESGLPETERVGTIVFAKAMLTGDLPYELLTYAARQPVFPHDSTSDQWFDVGQFGGYVELGRQLAEAVRRPSAASVGDAAGGDDAVSAGWGAREGGATTSQRPPATVTT